MESTALSALALALAAAGLAGVIDNKKQLAEKATKYCGELASREAKTGS